MARSNVPGNVSFDDDLAIEWSDTLWTTMGTAIELQTAIKYDALGRVTLTETLANEDPTLALWDTSAAYDQLTVTTTDANGVDATSVSDVFGNLVSATDDAGGLSATTAYGYDLSGRLTSVTDAAGNLTTMGYDLLGRKLWMSDPDMGFWSYTYDKAGNLKTQTDARATTLELVYDKLNRLTERKVDQVKVASWAYDATGQLGHLDLAESFEGGVSKVIVDPVNYDARGRITSTKWTITDGTTAEYLVDRAYDEFDRVASITYPSFGSARETVTTTYDNRTGRPTGMTTSAGSGDLVRNASYAADGRPTAQTWGAAAATGELDLSWEYHDQSLRLFKQKAGTGGTNTTDVSLLRWRYDTAGLITEVRDLKNAGQVQCFAYDPLRRLTDSFTTDDDIGTDSCADGYVKLSSNETGDYDVSYTYNIIGNLTGFTDHLDAANSVSYTYGTGGAPPHAVRAAVGSSSTDWFTYDAVGNVATRGGDTLGWDGESRLVSYSSGGDTTRFVYDADGTRVLRVEPDGTRTTSIGGVYEETVSGSSVTHRSFYSFGGSVIGVREYVPATGADDRHWFVSDHLGSNAMSVDYGTASVRREWFMPYGSSRGTSGGAPVTDHDFTGQVNDSSTGLMFYNARYYDPAIRRFISPDTIVPDPSAGQDFNRYTYVRNNPVMYTDPTGHVLLSPVIIGGACVRNGGNFTGSVSNSCTRAYSDGFRGEAAAINRSRRFVNTTNFRDQVRGFANGFLDSVEGLGNVLINGFIDSHPGGVFLPDVSVELPRFSCQDAHSCDLGSGLYTFVELMATAYGGAGLIDDATRLSGSIRLRRTVATRSVAAAWDDLDALAASGRRVIADDGLTRAAQKLQQHGGQGNLPVISGSVAQRNALATDLLDDILTSPGTRVVVNQGGNFAGGRTFIDELGRGAVYDADGVFQYFGVFD